MFVYFLNFSLLCTNKQNNQSAKEWLPAFIRLLIRLFTAKVGSFSFGQTNKPNKKGKMKKKAEKITREVLRAMQTGDTVTVQCADGYALESQKNTAYHFQKLENCRFTCKSEGLVLSVTRLS